MPYVPSVFLSSIFTIGNTPFDTCSTQEITVSVTVSKLIELNTSLF